MNFVSQVLRCPIYSLLLRGTLLLLMFCQANICHWIFQYLVLAFFILNRNVEEKHFWITDRYN
uniref:Uncharacterized protein n=1 Tax=Rhizophora mucronata TaxID=61149 RepID=A0A2P2MH30_RHIMU